WTEERGACDERRGKTGPKRRPEASGTKERGVMAPAHDTEAVGERVEGLLAELRAQAGEQAAATAEELVSCLVELYGAGLAKITEIAGQDGPELMAKLVADPLVESLLLVHDLHPLDTST